MNTIRCKFECVEVVKRKGWGENKFLYAAKFQGVTSGSEENEKFFAATPSGNLEVSTVKDDLFSVGKTYYLNLTPAE